MMHLTSSKLCHFERSGIALDLTHLSFRTERSSVRNLLFFLRREDGHALEREQQLVRAFDFLFGLQKFFTPRFARTLGALVDRVANSETVITGPSESARQAQPGRTTERVGHRVDGSKRKRPSRFLSTAFIYAGNDLEALRRRERAFFARGSLLPKS